MGEDIFDKAKNGDSECIELLVEQYARLAYSIAHDWVRKGVIPVEEAISEANVALIQCIRGSYDAKKGKFTSYLARAVDNQIRMYLRHERKEQQIEYVDSSVVTEDGNILDVIATLRDTSVSVEDLVERELMVAHIKKTMEALPGYEAECLWLRAEGKTCKQIAEQLGISPSYVSRLSLTAVEKIRKVFEER